MTWEDELDHADVDIINTLPRRGQRAEMISAVLGSSDCQGAAVGRVMRNKTRQPTISTGRGSNRRRPLYFNPGEFIVGGPGFAANVMESDEDESDGGAGNIVEETAPDVAD